MTELTVKEREKATIFLASLIAWLILRSLQVKPLYVVIFIEGFLVMMMAGAAYSLGKMERGKG